VNWEGIAIFTRGKYRYVENQPTTGPSGASNYVYFHVYSYTEGNSQIGHC